MNPINWLCDKAPGFAALSQREREVIMNFSLLWSFFEAKALSNEANPSTIDELVQSWERNNKLQFAPFSDSFEYFQRRYFENGVATEHFSGLNFRRPDKQALVEAVLKDENVNARDRVIALLMVAYRLRNNLFHGLKWTDELQGQFDNFTHANTILMRALELHEDF